MSVLVVWEHSMQVTIDILKVVDTQVDDMLPDPGLSPTGLGRGEYIPRQRASGSPVDDGSIAIAGL
jgi:hypothetical protein